LNSSKKTICYLCGKRGANSDHHIPPKCIFSKKTDDLITLRAHVDCNKESEKDDEYFLFFLSIAAFPESQKMRVLWKDKILRSINRIETQGYRSYINQHVYPITLLSNDVIENYDIFLADVARVNNILTKTARGLIFRDAGTFIRPSCNMEIELMGPNVRSQRGKDFRSIGDGIFKYQWHNKDDIFYMWLVFFDCVDFWITLKK
jgi:hypothetical protein